MPMRRLLSDIADLGGDQLSGKRYHYKEAIHNEPIQKRAANAVFRFWFRMILIGIAFSTLGSLATIYAAWNKQQALEAAAAAEVEQAKKRNPWALDK